MVSQHNTEGQYLLSGETRDASLSPTEVAESTVVAG